VSPEDIAHILKLRQGGMTLSNIAQRYGITESAVSLICAGKRTRKARGTTKKRTVKKLKTKAVKQDDPKKLPPERIIKIS
jgi:hypothetical protein